MSHNIVNVLALIFLTTSIIITRVNTMSIDKAIYDTKSYNIDKLENGNYNENDDPSTQKPEVNEYPLVITKRAAMLLDRLMVALHHALEDGDKEQSRKINEVYKYGRYGGRRYDNNKAIKGQSKYIIGGYTNDVIDNVDDDTDELLVRGLPLDQTNNLENNSQSENTMDLQRRGHDMSRSMSPNRGKVVRCYFNAVTCF